MWWSGRVKFGSHFVKQVLHFARWRGSPMPSGSRSAAAGWRALLGAVAVAGSAASGAGDVEVAVHDLNTQPLMDAVVFAQPVDVATAPPSHATAHALID